MDDGAILGQGSGLDQLIVPVDCKHLGRLVDQRLDEGQQIARVAASASGLYARNLLSFIETLVDKSTKALAVNWDDELVKATALTKDGAVIHPNFQPKA